MTKHYELLALVSGALSDEETQNVQQTLRALLEKQEARISKQEIWERRKLAYPVKHVRQGTYILFTFDVEPAQMKPLNAALLLEKLLLRFHVIIAHQKTAKELEAEVRQQASMRTEERAETAAATEKPAAPISTEELDEKLAEILTDDIVK